MTDEITVARLLSAAAEHHIILIPSRHELLIRAPATAPDDLVDMLHLYAAELLATLKGNAKFQR